MVRIQPILWGRISTVRTCESFQGHDGRVNRLVDRADGSDEMGNTVKCRCENPFLGLEVSDGSGISSDLVEQSTHEPRRGAEEVAETCSVD